MDHRYVQKAIESNCPFVIKTAGGDSYPVPHRDFISFSKKRTTVVVHYEDEQGHEDMAIIPLLTMTSVEVDPSTVFSD